jgi:hypothetical protein
MIQGSELIVAIEVERALHDSNPVRTAPRLVALLISIAGEMWILSVVFVSFVYRRPVHVAPCYFSRFPGRCNQPICVGPKQGKETAKPTLRCGVDDFFSSFLGNVFLLSRYDGEHLVPLSIPLARQLSISSPPRRQDPIHFSRQLRSVVEKRKLARFT